MSYTTHTIGREKGAQRSSWNATYVHIVVMSFPSHLQWCRGASKTPCRTSNWQTLQAYKHRSVCLPAQHNKIQQRTCPSSSRVPMYFSAKSLNLVASSLAMPASASSTCWGKSCSCAFLKLAPSVIHVVFTCTGTNHSKSSTLGNCQLTLASLRHKTALEHMKSLCYGINVLAFHVPHRSPDGHHS